MAPASMTTVMLCLDRKSCLETYLPGAGKCTVWQASRAACIETVSSVALSPIAPWSSTEHDVRSKGPSAFSSSNLSSGASAVDDRDPGVLVGPHSAKQAALVSPPLEVPTHLFCLQT